MKVLAIIAHYFPAFLAGGPIQSLHNMTELLGDEIHFRVLTTNRDLDQTTPLAVAVDEWTDVGKAEVYYADASRLKLAELQRVIASEDYDVLYLNSFFSVGFAIRPLLLRRLGRIARRPAIIAPRGEFGAGLTVGGLVKRMKKRVYCRCAAASGFCRGVLWQACSEQEVNAIHRMYPWAQIHLAPNLAIPPLANVPPRDKRPGAARFVFISRISPKKGLDRALDLLGRLRGEVDFEIYGLQEDAALWERCQTKIAALPANIRAHYGGVVDRAQLSTVLGRAEFFFLPTLGENFGHSIVEAMAYGCPVIISDRTPWRQLAAAGAGWDIALEDDNGFVAALQQCVDMGPAAYRTHCEQALAYAQARVNTPAVVAATRELFARAAKMTV